MLTKFDLFNTVRSGTTVHCFLSNNQSYKPQRLFINTVNVFLFFNITFLLMSIGNNPEISKYQESLSAHYKYYINLYECHSITVCGGLIQIVKLLSFGISTVYLCLLSKHEFKNKIHLTITSSFSSS